jgi:nucleoside-diphosphate-sugar epimerase
VSDDRSSTEIYHYVLDENSYYPKGDLNYLDVRDAALIIRMLVEKEAWGERFILNKESISYQDFFKIMAEVFGKKAPLKIAEPYLIRIAVLYNGILRRLRLSKNPLNMQTAMIAQQKMFYENKKILEFLDFEFTSLEDTFKWAK